MLTDLRMRNEPIRIKRRSGVANRNSRQTQLIEQLEAELIEEKQKFRAAQRADSRKRRSNTRNTHHQINTRPDSGTVIQSLCRSSQLESMAMKPVSRMTRLHHKGLCAQRSRS